MLANLPPVVENIMSFLGYDHISFWIVVTAIFVNVSCALLGCFLVLRRMSLLGDAISHAILPGLALGFILTGSRDIVPMLIGALVVGLLTALLTQTLHRFARVPEDAAMGVVFTSLFAIGVIMIHRVAKQVDLDPGCVLYGMIETAALDTVMIGGYDISRPALNMGVICAIVIVFVALMWKELKIVSFDPDLATAQGINANLVHYMLMGMVAGVTVAAFEAVGSILVVAMLIAPAAAAYMLTDRLGYMVFIAAILGVIAAFMGRSLAHTYRSSVPGMMAVVAGGLFVVAVLVSPSHGVIMKYIRQLNLTLRIVREDVLALLYRWNEISPKTSLEKQQASAALGGGLLPHMALWFLERDGKIKTALAASGRAGILLTDKGVKEAQTLVKSHRIWETYLQQVLGFAPDHLHASADRTEHFMSEGLTREIAAAVENPTIDPHGKPIPRREGSRVDIETSEN
jgi:manganese/zinc/iron transport system permease protein